VYVFTVKGWEDCFKAFLSYLRGRHGVRDEEVAVLKTFVDAADLPTGLVALARYVMEVCAQGVREVSLQEVLAWRESRPNGVDEIALALGSGWHPTIRPSDVDWVIADVRKDAEARGGANGSGAGEACLLVRSAASIGDRSGDIGELAATMLRSSNGNGLLWAVLSCKGVDPKRVEGGKVAPWAQLEGWFGFEEEAAVLTGAGPADLWVVLLEAGGLMVDEGCVPALTEIAISGTDSQSAAAHLILQHAGLKAKSGVDAILRALEEGRAVRPFSLCKTIESIMAVEDIPRAKDSLTRLRNGGVETRLLRAIQRVESLDE
jgi:hypothetical protein